MTDFTNFTDAQVLVYLVEHYADIGVGEPISGLADNILRDLKRDFVAVEKRPGAFAIVVKANRKHAGFAGSIIRIPPQADLLFLFTAPEARGSGVGSTLLRTVKEKYLEDQAMELVCAGQERKAFFERAGFIEHSLTEEGLHYMLCPPLPAVNTQDRH
jgi:GNAT superfamily N-acetyltransferase